MRLHDLPDQPRLADTRLPDDRHDLAVAGGRAGQHLTELRQLRTPPHQGRQGAPFHVEPEALASDPHPVPGHHVVSRRLQSEATLDEAGGGSVEDDAVPPRLLQERGHRRPRLAPSAGIEAGGGATCRHQVSAEMDGAASAQPAEARVLPRTECLDHGPCGVDGPSRAVLHRADAEHGHEPHRREVLDPRPEARYLSDQPLQHPGKLEGRGALWRVELHSQDRDQALFPADAQHGHGGFRRGPRRRRCRKRFARWLVRRGLAEAEPMLRHPVAQRVAWDPEPGRRPCDVAPRLGERLDELLTLPAPQVAQRQARPPGWRFRRPPAPARRQAEHRGRDHRAVREQRHPLEHVRQLPHVPGPA